MLWGLRTELLHHQILRQLTLDLVEGHLELLLAERARVMARVSHPAAVLDDGGLTSC